MTTRQNCNRNNYGPFDELSQDMERVFDSLLGKTVGTILRPGATEKFVPSMDVGESEDAFFMTLDLPGVNPDEVKIELHEGKLTVSGERTAAGKAEGVKYHRIERTSGEFKRVVSLPTDVDLEKIDAEYRHGLLTVTLPKIAKKQPTQIEIRTAD
ncbi:MAG: Hsp20/alpha crystallin family protein [Planctomycetota bacterium]